MYYLFFLVFFSSLYCATNYVPHVLLMQDEYDGKEGIFKFLIEQTDPSKNCWGKFHANLSVLESGDNQEDRFPIEYLLSYFSESFNEGQYKRSRKIHKDTFYDDMVAESNGISPLVFAATDNCCKYLFSYLNSIIYETKNIRCIFIHNPTLYQNARITKRYKSTLSSIIPCIEKLPYLGYIIPLFHELASKLKGQSHDAFAKDIIHYAHNISHSNTFYNIPIVITYDKDFSDDAFSLHEILIRNPSLPKECHNKIVLLTTQRDNLKIFINNIISTYFINNLFEKLMNSENGILINTDRSNKTNKMIQNAQWFQSKTPLQQFLIRRTRDLGLLVLLFGTIVCCYKTIKTFS